MKTWIIIKREYLTRIRKRSFIITTLLIPFLFLAFGAISVGIAMYSKDHKNIAVVDDTHSMAPKLKNTEDISYTVLQNTTLDAARKLKDIDGVLHITAFNIDSPATFNIYSTDQLGMGAQDHVESALNDVVINERLLQAGINIKEVDELRANTIKLKPIDNKGKESSNELTYAIGFASGFLLYMFMFLYGFGVMRSVMEEKTNRIAEIIVSSVKPFQLMMGKIIGVAMVGLTQFLIWVILIGLISTVGGSLMGAAMMGGDAGIGADMANAQNPDMMNTVMGIMGSANWGVIIAWFLFYFLGGYFLYASLFAAVGSLVDDDAQDAQQLTFPITLPIIIGFIIMTTAVRNPNSAIAVVGSIFPLTSPIVMMARIPYGISGDMLWQLPLSAVLLVLGFIFTTGLAAKIYRTGILLYGKKVTLKEVGKWLLRK